LFNNFFCYFSATASYRLLPHISFHKTITGELADRVVKCFSKGVIKLKTGSNG